jgi:predicted hydrocarbon binding protein
MDNSILAELQFDPDRGALLYQGVRYLLVRPETLSAFQKAVEDKLGAEADELFYAGGFAGGSLSAKKYQDVFKLTAEQSVAFMARMGTEIGWGKLDVERLDMATGELTVRIESSPFAAAYGQSARGVCHLVRGVFAGLASGIFSREVDAREVECAAMGHATCMIVIEARR